MPGLRCARCECRSAGASGSGSVPLIREIDKSIVVSILRGVHNAPYDELVFAASMGPHAVGPLPLSSLSLDGINLPAIRDRFQRNCCTSFLG